VTKTIELKFIKRTIVFIYDDSRTSLIMIYPVICLWSCNLHVSNATRALQREATYHNICKGNISTWTAMLRV